MKQLSWENYCQVSIAKLKEYSIARKGSEMDEIISKIQIVHCKDSTLDCPRDVVRLCLALWIRKQQVIENVFTVSTSE